jgi:callose synthase
VLIKSVRRPASRSPSPALPAPSPGSSDSSSGGGGGSGFVDEIREVYRVQLPGDPIIGEGKPENQNHAIIFTRGEVLQAIDMNQAGYLEEALKMRNLIREFDFKDSGRTATIVGFREHIYTGSLSSIANYMALQEGCFVSLGQRVLHSPLLMRLHYGHPDLFDKLFSITRGGISKAARALHLSEDIYAGFNHVLRGGHVAMREYIQVGKGRDVGLQQLFKFEAKLAQGAAMQSLSRDVYRMAWSLDFFRLLSFYYGGIGFYLSNSLTIWALYLFLYSRLFIAAFGLEDPHSFSGTDTFAYWFGQCGFLLTLPIFASLGLENGFGTACLQVVQMVVTGGPLFFMFHMGTKAHYFEQTLLGARAVYRPTGRGFVTQHEHFAEIFRFHAASHFYKAVEMMSVHTPPPLHCTPCLCLLLTPSPASTVSLMLWSLLLLLYATCKTSGPTSFGTITWAAWLIAFGWIFAPFWFNPSGFEWDRFVEDVSEWRAWMARGEGDGDKSWTVWWRDELQYLQDVSVLNRCILAVTSARHAIVAVALLYYNATAPIETAIAAAVLLGAWLLHACLTHPLTIHYPSHARAFKGAPPSHTHPPRYTCPVRLFC